MNTPLLAVEGLTKDYGRHRVLSDVSLTLGAGEATAVLGENGAGKSTFAKILAGVVSADAGKIMLQGQQLNLSSPRDALTAGIAFIPQELIYVPQLTVAENIVLGRWPSRGGLTSPGRIRTLAKRELTRYGFQLPLGKLMNSLTLAEQQQVEILKALARESRVIVLDEPTAALNADDSRQLLELMGRFSASGVSLIYISHRLDEVFSSCTSVHVLRNGHLVQSSDVQNTSPKEIIGSMLGHGDQASIQNTATPERGKRMLKLRDWSRESTPSLHNASLDVHASEVVGLYGVQGAGAEVVAEALGGLHPDVRGDLAIGDRSVRVPRSPAAARRMGVAYVPADRKSQGLVMTLSVQQSLVLLICGTLTRAGVISAHAEARVAGPIADQVKLKAQGLRQPVGELSGGNQQKVLVGSRLASKPKVLVLQEPTRGVDVGARQEIHRLLRELVTGGTATLLVTSDIEEAVTLSDRLLIVRGGRVVHEMIAPTIQSQAEALQAAGGIE